MLRQQWIVRTYTNDMSEPTVLTNGNKSTQDVRLGTPKARHVSSLRLIDQWIVLWTVGCGQYYLVLRAKTAQTIQNHIQ